ncbi:transcription factor CP2 [Nilaparvata lugens]|uniref:transcription factor CP2 n=1 Tax=Nilaparvata lugens TaxID=108931 RepID=UPI00193CA2B4|nr:transcription factor CP2 [Nilaparvata lugens]
MEFLIMADEMMNSSSFLEAADQDLGGWGAVWPDDVMGGGHSEVGAQANPSRKRKAGAPMHPLPSSADYKMHHDSAPKQAKDDRDDQSSSGWQAPAMEELGNCSNLADELDSSCGLTGISVDLNQSSYNNISDALLTLPSLTVFKQELPSPGNNNHDNSVLSYNNYNGNSNGSGNLSPNLLCPSNGVAANAASNNINSTSPSQSQSAQLKSMMLYNATDERKDKPAPPVPVCLVIPDNTMSALSSEKSANDFKEKIACGEGSTRAAAAASKRSELEGNKNSNIAVSSSCMSPTSSSEPSAEDCRFQYVLAAATSIATKVNEETQTYLNQGQSYEIKLKKLGDLSNYRGKVLKSVVRLSFHERRLQYTESEQMAAWVASHPMQRLLEADLPLSYGIVDVLQHDSLLNTIQFLWDPTKEVGVYIKVNCISTEFTPNKHGGEKGVPFRIQVETSLHGQSPPCRLHTASCQIKVFKLKGADRKHKQDREKILKRPLIEQEKYQPSYDCTVLNDMPNDADPVFSPIAITNNQPVVATAAIQSPDNKRGSASVEQRSPLRAAAVSSANQAEPPTSSQACQQLQQLVPRVATQPQDANTNNFEVGLSRTATVQQANVWLQTNRFSAFLRTFSNFSGLDLLRLSCDNLIQICGLPEGIRLFNALHRSPLSPRLTLYMCVDTSVDVYQALYLETLTSAELGRKLAALVQCASPVAGAQLLLQGPTGIHVAVSDQVVANMKDEAVFVVERLSSPGQADQFCLLLKPSNRTR